MGDIRQKWPYIYIYQNMWGGLDGMRNGISIVENQIAKSMETLGIWGGYR